MGSPGFNPRTPAGCDPALTHTRALRCWFQSTHPCGVRLLTQSDAGLSRRVSIHAPLRGATAPLYKLDSGFYRFNPRTPAGCDSSLIRPCTCGDLFQSTHPCGVRHRLGPMCDMHSGRFNPRTPAGCDSHLLKLGISPLGFQSSLPCGMLLR